MLANQIPICQFATNVTFVDDDISFAQSLISNMPKGLASYSYFNNPRKALIHLSKQFNPDPFEMNWVARKAEDEDFEHRIVDASVSDIHKEIYHKNRFNQVSTVVVDYKMPQMNGLEFCQKLKDVRPNIKCILLTGVADSKKAVEAFNEGLIDNYLPKGIKDLDEAVAKSIRAAQRKYFLSVNQTMSDIIQRSSDDSALNDPLFLDFFAMLKSELHIDEHYLFETTGSALLLNKDKLFALFVRTEKQLESDCEIATDGLECEQLKSDLKSKKKMICCPTTESFMSEFGRACKRYIHDAKTLDGKQRYYYALTPYCPWLKKNDVARFGPAIAKEIGQQLLTA